jgi:hypothetical protein
MSATSERTAPRSTRIRSGSSGLVEGVFHHSVADLPRLRASAHTSSTESTSARSCARERSIARRQAHDSNVGGVGRRTWVECRDDRGVRFGLRQVG